MREVDRRGIHASRLEGEQSPNYGRRMLKVFLVARIKLRVARLGLLLTLVASGINGNGDVMYVTAFVMLPHFAAGKPCHNDQDESNNDATTNFIV